METACFNCKYWKRHTQWGNCTGYGTGKMKYIDIIVSGGHSTPDKVLTRDIFFCAHFKNKHKH